MIQNIIAVVVIMLVLALIGYRISKYLNSEDQTTQDPATQYTPEELDNIKLAEELYNKDLRPVVAKKAKPQVAEELNVVEPEFIAKVVDIAKVLPPDATINAEAIAQPKESKSEFPIDKSKKKKKYYPKTKK